PPPSAPSASLLSFSFLPSPPRALYSPSLHDALPISHPATRSATSPQAEHSARAHRSAVGTYARLRGHQPRAHSASGCTGGGGHPFRPVVRDLPAVRPLAGGDDDRPVPAPAGRAQQRRTGRPGRRPRPAIAA